MTPVPHIETCDPSRRLNLLRPNRRAQIQKSAVPKSLKHLPHDANREHANKTHQAVPFKSPVTSVSNVKLAADTLHKSP
jgi:hypothetical protein